MHLCVRQRMMHPSCGAAECCVAKGGTVLRTASVSSFYFEFRCKHHESAAVPSCSTGCVCCCLVSRQSQMLHNSFMTKQLNCTSKKVHNGLGYSVPVVDTADCKALTGGLEAMHGVCLLILQLQCTAQASQLEEALMSYTALVMHTPQLDGASCCLHSTQPYRNH